MITLAYYTKREFITQKIDDSTQIINRLTLVIYEMVNTGFSLQDELRKVLFLKKTFLLADTSIVVVPKMLFFFFSHADVCFAKKDLI